jgi:hypothetical protein
MGDEVDVKAVAKEAVSEYLDAKDAFAQAQNDFVEAEKRYRVACKDAALKCPGIAFKGKKGFFFFSKVRGDGNYALKPFQDRWTTEGKTVVDCKDRL